MPTHLYCLVPARGELRLPGTPPIRVLGFGPVSAWVSDAAGAALSRDARDVARAAVEHDRVIGAALGQGVTPLPAALADPYEDDAAASADIALHMGAIADALDRMQGRVEMTIIVALTDAPPPPDAAGRGRAYMEQLRSQSSRANEVADRIAASLEPIAGNGRRRADRGRVAVSHLVDRGAVDEYRVRALASAGDGYRIVIDGPRAPYSFARYSPRRGVIADAPAPTA
jgi:hypothetical protein